MQALQKSPKILFIIAFILLSLLYMNTIAWLIGSWIYNSYYTHGFIVLAISIYISYRVVRNSKLKAEVDVRGLYLLSASLIVHVLAVLWNVMFLSAVSLLTAVYGIILIFYAGVAKRLAFPVFFMLLAVPLPIYSFANQLEIISAQSSVNLVNLFGVKASNIGAEIYLKTCYFIVGAPCSGIRSILSLLTVATFYAYLINDKVWIKALIILLSLPLAILANILRISSILIVADKYGKDVAMNFFHYASDIFFFITVLIVLMLIRRCLNWLISNRLS